jgi:hypothetical protein
MSILSRILRYLRLGVAPVASQSREEGPITKHANEPAGKKAPVRATPSRARAERTLIIGVDFGTNSTKVIWQDFSADSFEVFQWQPGAKGLASILLPSTVAIRDGALCFGVSEQDVRKGDILLRSIKLCVLCSRKSSICRCGNATATAGAIRMFKNAEPIPASAVCCLFLAYVFRQVEDRLISQYPDEHLHMVWNIGCPLDHLDATGRRGEWERMTGAAMELRTRVLNPADRTLVAEAARLIQHFTVPRQEVRKYFVQPEGLAAVKAFLESPHAEPRTYAIIDVGAGTTEVSFFFNGRVTTEPGHPYRPSYLADSTEAVGGSKIDVELAKVWRCSVEEARQRKEATENAAPIVSAIGEICRQYQSTCGEIIRHRKLVSPHDMRFKLFIIGGGGRLECLKGALTRTGLPKPFLREALLQLMPPRKLKHNPGIVENYDLFANACGLASSIGWEYYPPSEVPAMERKVLRRADPRPDRDELYPK